MVIPFGECNLCCTHTVFVLPLVEYTSCRSVKEARTLAEYECDRETTAEPVMDGVQNYESYQYDLSEF